MGHRVTVVAGSYPGAERLQHPAPGLELHHVGTRLTVFPRAALLVKRGAIRDVDVALEVINGIAFLTPLWRLGVPRVALVFHVHRDMYVEELGPRGAVAASGGEVVRVDGIPQRAVDSTGAGDLFLAAYAWADLHGAGLEERLQWATAYASLSVRVPTGAAGAPTLGELVAATGMPAPARRPARSSLGVMVGLLPDIRRVSLCVTGALASACSRFLSATSGSFGHCGCAARALPGATGSRRSILGGITSGARSW
jgi:hypothetical protein